MIETPHHFIPHGDPSIGSCVRCGRAKDDPAHQDPPLMRGLEVIVANSDHLHRIAVPDARIGRHEMFLEIASILRKRSTCNRGKVGCVIVQDRRIVSHGYNGSPAGSPHCLDIGCEPHVNEHVEGCMRTVHAEANAIAFAAKHGIATDGATMYSTHSPCHGCAKLIVSAGIIELHYTTPYRDERLDVLEEGGCVVVKA